MTWQLVIQTSRMPQQTQLLIKFEPVVFIPHLLKTSYDSVWTNTSPPNPGHSQYQHDKQLNINAILSFSSDH